MKARPLLLVVALALCVTAGHAQKLKPEQLAEREALISLKTAVTANQFGTSRMKSWKNKGAPCAPKPWPHLICKDGRVVGLSLSNLNVAATLPLKLRQLNKLETLQLDGNRLAGGLPLGWADPNYFQSLRTLDLHSNNLGGVLPSKDWNKKGAFKSLTRLDLSDNGFVGGLPVGWLAGNKVMSKLTFLDLSQNNLGTADGQNAITKDKWCPTDTSYGAAASSYGWCPSGKPLPGTMANLITLDLSFNNFQGELPSQWPVMFPNLQYFLIAGNELHSGSSDRPAPLPSGWTQSKYPIAFPQLNTLVLYPGNDNLCNLPNFVGGTLDGFMEVNPDNTYRLVSYDDPTGEDYTADNIWACQGPAADNPPTSVSLYGSMVTWAPPASGEGNVVFGYRVTVEVQDPEDGSFNLDHNWSGRLFRIYTYGTPSTKPDLVPGSGGLYSVDTGLAAGLTLRASVSSFNVDGQESDVASSDATASKSLGPSLTINPPSTLYPISESFIHFFSSGAGTFVKFDWALSSDDWATYSRALSGFRVTLTRTDDMNKAGPYNMLDGWEDVVLRATFPSTPGATAKTPIARPPGIFQEARNADNTRKTQFEVQTQVPLVVQRYYKATVVALYKDERQSVEYTIGPTWL